MCNHSKVNVKRRTHLFFVRHMQCNRSKQYNLALSYALKRQTDASAVADSLNDKVNVKYQKRNSHIDNVSHMPSERIMLATQSSNSTTCQCV